MRPYNARMSKAEELERKYTLLFPHLNERQKHLIAAFDAQQLGRGGISIVSRATGFSRPTIYRAIESLSQPPLPVERVRHSGAGRKTLVSHDPHLVRALEALIDPDTRGDPMSPLRWTCKSTRVLARLLTAQGHPVSYMTVAQLLHDLHYSLQGNAKTKEGKQHPDRDAQFRYIQRQGESFLARGWPVISIDTKKWDRSAKWSQFRSLRRQRRRWLDRVGRDRRAHQRRSARGEMRGVAPDPRWGVPQFGADGLARRSCLVSQAWTTEPPPIHSPRTATRLNRMARPASQRSSQGTACGFWSRASGPTRARIVEKPAACTTPRTIAGRTQGWAGRPGHSRRMRLTDHEHPIQTWTRRVGSRTGRV